MLLATVRGSASLCPPRAASGLLTTGVVTTRGAPAGRRSSSDVPHIPQNLKFDELSSPQFGQITIISPEVSNSLTPKVRGQRSDCSKRAEVRGQIAEVKPIGSSRPLESKAVTSAI